MSRSPVIPSENDLDLVSRTAREIARTRRFSPSDTQDFVQWVHVRLLERRYEVFARFQGRSSLQTYLRVVIGRLAIDKMNSERGKWRPTAEAARAGGAGIALDRLINRDGCSIDQAVQIVAQRDGMPAARRLTALAEHLPVHPRRCFVSGETLEALSTGPFLDPIVERDDRRAKAELARALRRAMRELPTEDSRLLTRRYVQGQTVRTIARELGVDPRLLYRRFERTLRRLRRLLPDRDGSVLRRRRAANVVA